MVKISICVDFGLLGGDAAASHKFTNGFPTRLVYRIFPISPSQSSTQLIPEMNFICNGTIVGYTIAGDVTGDQHQIQVWRENDDPSQLGVHYNKIDTIQIDEHLCEGGPRTMHSNEKVFHCNLTTSNRVSIQTGDILGLKLPHDSGLFFATATEAPTNYVFMGDASLLALANNISSPKLLPQITLEIGI